VPPVEEVLGFNEASADMIANAFQDKEERRAASAGVH
jgi:hypothetical protein